MNPRQALKCHSTSTPRHRFTRSLKCLPNSLKRYWHYCWKASFIDIELGAVDLRMASGWQSRPSIPSQTSECVSLISFEEAVMIEVWIYVRQPKFSCPDAHVRYYRMSEFELDPLKDGQAWSQFHSEDRYEHWKLMARSDPSVGCGSHQDELKFVKSKWCYSQWMAMILCWLFEQLPVILKSKDYTIGDLKAPGPCG